MIISHIPSVNYALWAVCIMLGVSILGGTQYFALTLIYGALAFGALALFWLVEPLFTKKAKPVKTTLETVQPMAIRTTKKSKFEIAKEELMSIPAYARKEMGIGYPITSLTHKDVIKYREMKGA